MSIVLLFEYTKDIIVLVLVSNIESFHIHSCLLLPKFYVSHIALYTFLGLVRYLNNYFINICLPIYEIKRVN